MIRKYDFKSLINLNLDKLLEINKMNRNKNYYTKCILLFPMYLNYFLNLIVVILFAHQQVNIFYI